MRNGLILKRLGKDWGYIFLHITSFGTYLSMICWKMTWRCKIRFRKVTLNYAMIHPGEHRMSGDPWKCSFGSADLSLAACKNSEWTSSCCWTTLASSMNVEPRLKIGSLPTVLCSYNTDVPSLYWMFGLTSLVKVTVQLMRRIWTGWIFWMKIASKRKGGFAQLLP